MSSSDSAAERPADPGGTAADSKYAPSRPMVILAAYYGSGCRP